MKNIKSFLSDNFQFLEVKFSVYLNRSVFVMGERGCRRNQGDVKLSTLLSHMKKMTSAEKTKNKKKKKKKKNRTCPLQMS